MRSTLPKLRASSCRTRPGASMLQRMWRLQRETAAGAPPVHARPPPPCPPPAGNAACSGRALLPNPPIRHTYRGMQMQALYMPCYFSACVRDHSFLKCPHVRLPGRQAWLLGLLWYTHQHRKCKATASQLKLPCHAAGCVALQDLSDERSFMSQCRDAQPWTISRQSLTCRHFVRACFTK